MGSVQQVHSMTLNVGAFNISGFLMLEFASNETGVPWTDYHVDITGGTFDIVMGALFNVVGGEIVGGPMMMASEDVVVMTDMAWFFFDEPILSSSISSGGDGVLFAFEASIIKNSIGSNLTITQHPSIPEPGTLALFGFGLAGLGFARRRRMI